MPLCANSRFHYRKSLAQGGSRQLVCNLCAVGGVLEAVCMHVMQPQALIGCLLVLRNWQ